jgi:transcriptional regulator of NAD metabolism
LKKSDSETRREGILKTLSAVASPVPGMELAKKFGVSRQVIVQDIALIRAEGTPVISTSRGYLLSEENPGAVRRRFRVSHTDEEMERELNLIVDYGGTVIDVIVEHPLYGEVSGRLDLSSRWEVSEFMKRREKYEGRALMTLARGNVHIHTVEADSVDVLSKIEYELKKAGFLVLN